MSNTLPISLNLNSSFIKKDKSLKLEKTSNFKEKMDQYTLKEKETDKNSQNSINKNTKKTFKNSDETDQLKKKKETIEKEIEQDYGVDNNKTEENKEVSKANKDEDNSSIEKAEKEDINLDEDLLQTKENKDEKKEVLEEIIAFLQNSTIKDSSDPKVKQLKEALEKINADLLSSNLDRKELESVLKSLKEADFIPENMKNEIFNQFKIELKKEIENTTSLENKGALEANENSNPRRIKEDKREIEKQEKIESGDKKEGTLEKVALKESTQENFLPYKDEELDQFEKDFFKMGEKNIQEDNNINVENLNIGKITQKVKNTITPLKEGTNINPKEIIDQITKKSKLTINKDNTVMEMKLEPESLGKLTLKVALERGILTAKFTAENDKVKEIIENNLEQLRNNLVAQGLNIESLSVSVDSQGDLDRHKNILEAMAYSKKLSKNISISTSIEEEKENPYLNIEENINQLG